METGDRCDALEASMPQTHGLTRRDPAALLLVQPTQQQIELPMIFLSGMFTRTASSTTALVNRPWRAHCPTPFLGVPNSLHQIVDITE